MNYNEAKQAVLSAYAVKGNAGTIAKNLSEKCWNLHAALYNAEKSGKEIPEALSSEHAETKLSAEAARIALAKAEIVYDICKDNARRAWIAEKLPAFLEMLDTIKGKKFGPKTAQAFDAAVRAELEVHVRFRYSFGDKTIAVFSALNPDDRRIIGGNDIEAVCDYDVLPDNKVVSAPLSCWKVLYLPEIVEDPETRADEIENASRLVRFEWESFNERLNEYNDLLPTAANGPFYDGGFSLSNLYKFHGLFGR